MINFAETQHKWSVERSVLTSELALITAGMALVGVNTDLAGGTFRVKRSSGSTTEVLEGIAMLPKKAGGTWFKMEQITVPSSGPYVVVLNKLASGSIGAFKNADGVAVAVSGGAASGSNIQSATDAVTGNTSLTFDSSFAGVTWNVAYNYALSAYEESLVVGQFAGAHAIEMLKTVSVFKQGRIALNNVDPTANWHIAGATPKVKIIAGGLFTDSASGSTGFTPVNTTIVKVPTVASPWLVLDLF